MDFLGNGWGMKSKRGRFGGVKNSNLTNEAQLLRIFTKGQGGPSVHDSNNPEGAPSRPHWARWDLTPTL
jgi:hypothetical protein